MTLFLRSGTIILSLFLLILWQNGLVVQAQPANDMCSAATVVSTLPYNGNGGTVDAAPDGSFPSCSVSPTDQGVWYKYTPPSDKILQVQVKETSFNTRLSAFTGTCAGIACIGSNDGASYYDSTSALTMQAVAGTEYKLLVTGVSSTSGSFNIGIMELERPSNDNCETATAISSNVSSLLLAEDNTGAFTDFEADTCGGALKSSTRGIWYSFVGNDKILDVKVAEPSFDTRLTAFTGPCDKITCVGSNDGASYYDSTSALTMQAVAGTEYKLLVSGAATFSQVGIFDLQVNALERPSNDNCKTATAISSNVSSLLLAEDNTGAFTDFEADTCGGALKSSTRGIWYSFVGNDKILDVKVAEPSFDTRLTAFTGPCDKITCVGSNDGASYYDSTSALTMQAVAGTEYKLLVSGAATFSQVGIFDLQVNALERPSNDNCKTATAISSNVSSLLLAEDNTGAFTDFEADTCGGALKSSTRGIWYSFVGNDKILDVKVAEPSFDTRLTAFTGPCDKITCVGSNDGASYYDSTSALTMQAVAGTEYKLLVSGAATFSQVGIFDLQVNAHERPSNDSCETATVIPSTPFQLNNQDNTGAFSDFADDKCAVKSSARGMWYSFVGEDGTVEVKVTEPSFNTRLTAFTGPCDEIVCLGSNDGASYYDSTSALTLETVAGTEYKLLVSGANSLYDAGTFNIVVTGPVRFSTAPPTVTPLSLPPTEAPTRGPNREPTPAPAGPAGFSTAPPMTAPSPSAPTIAPVVGSNTEPTPSPSGDCGFICVIFPTCFSGRMNVELEDGRSVPLRSVAVGDKVKVDIETNKYETIYGFGHREEFATSDDFLKIGWQTSGGSSHHSFLEISEAHMLLIASRSKRAKKEWRMVPASKVVVGDEVMVEGATIAKVSSISKIRGQGLFAPLTFSGKIVVNGCQASQYISVQNEEHLILSTGTRVLLNYHWLSHAFLLPLRWIAPLMQDVTWMQSFLLNLLGILEYALSLPAPLLLPIAIPVLAIVGTMSLVETIVLVAVDHKVAFLLLVLTIAVIRQNWKASICLLKKKNA